MQTNADELRENLPPTLPADNDILSQLQQLGFDEEIARLALETSENSLDSAIEFLMKLHGNEEELESLMTRMMELATSTADNNDYGGPSTSSGADSLLTKALDQAKKEMESLKAYDRFTQELTNTEQDYLDLPLVQEEQILAEYKRLLEQ